MRTHAHDVPDELFDDFRPGPFETLDRPALFSHLICITIGSLFLWLIVQTPVKPFESLTLAQLPERVSHLLLNQSDLARLSAPERAAVPPGAVAPTTPEQKQEETESTPPPTESHVRPPADARGVPSREPGNGGGGGSGEGAEVIALGKQAAEGAVGPIDQVGH